MRAKCRFLIATYVVLSLASPFQAQAQIVSIAPGVRPAPNPQQTEIIVTFRGGTIDDNIVAFYRRLMAIGALPTRKVSIAGKDLETTLLEENVLFAYYPKDLNDFMGSINRGNRDLTFTKAQPTAKQQAVYHTDSSIVVPDLKFDHYRYLEVLSLDGQSLTSVATQRHLYRQYDPSLKQAVSLANDEVTQRELARLNPKYANANLLRLSEGRVVFPAEGFVTRLQVPSNLVDKVMTFSRPNVYLSITTGPTARSYARVETAAGTLTADQDPVGLTCQEPLSATFNKHLAAIAYELPKDLGQNSLRFPSIAVLDSFPPPSARKVAEREYLKELRKLYKNDYTLDAREIEGLEQLRVKLKLNSEWAAAIQNRVKGEEVSEQRYDLSEYPEFQNGPLTLQSQVIDSTDAAAAKSIGELDHGLHVAAIIAARCNGYGIAGMVPFAEPAVYSLLSGAAGDVLPQDALTDLGSTGDCQLKPCVINASWVYPEDKIGRAFGDDIEEFVEEYLVVAAAGAGADNQGRIGPDGEQQGAPFRDACALVPACLGERPNVITVTSFSAESPTVLDPKANFSENGKATVALAAPGQNVLSAVRGGKFFALSGTSQATAFVTGAAALLETLNDRLKPRQIKNRLLYTADLEYTYDGKVAFGRLNVKRALSYQNEDIVYLGGDVPRRGVFDYAVDTRTGNATRALLLYRRGRENNQVTDCQLSRVRRIFKNANGYYTVAYEDKETGKLKVERDVTFYPAGRPQHIGDRLTDSFKLVKCGQAKPDEAISTRDWVARCPAASRTTENITLDQITDLIVRADAGVR